MGTCFAGATAFSASSLIELSLSPNKTAIKSGELLSIKLVIKDISNKVVHVNQVYTKYKFSIIDDGGREPQKTQTAQQSENLRDSGNIAMSPRQLQPNAVFSEDIALSNLYDLTHPGTYTLYIEGNAVGNPVRVRSNTISIIVTP